MSVILVTGANRGIGRELCKQLAARGADVIASSRSGSANPYGAALRLDVTDEPGIAQAAETVAAEWGHIDILINNAAVLLDQGRSILELSSATLRATLEPNLIGPLRVAQAFWPLIREAGCVINISSMSGQFADMDDWAPGYSISKAALNALTVQLAIAGRSRRIRVNSLCPGWVKTDMGGAQAPGSVAEGAAGIVWLALDAPKNLTGRFFHNGKQIPW
jgi:NAD(P)-dependent dehydrogenase (short-subunit alcohol dehydrogenase family)